MQREALTSDLMKRVSLGNSRTYLYVWCTLKPYNLGDVSAVLDNGDRTGNDVHETEECAHEVRSECCPQTRIRQKSTLERALVRASLDDARVHAIARTGEEYESHGKQRGKGPVGSGAWRLNAAHRGRGADAGMTPLEQKLMEWEDPTLRSPFRASPGAVESTSGRRTYLRQNRERYRRR